MTQASRRALQCLAVAGALLAPLVGHADGPERRDGTTVPTSTASSASPRAGAAATSDADLETSPPDRYLPRVMRCRRYGGKRYCEGPRRVPVPFGSAAARAERLGLGTRRAAIRARDDGPPDSWVAETEGQSHRRLIFPVDEGRQGRGLARRRGRRPGHDGVDIMAQSGATIRSVEDGLIVYSDNELRGYGNVLLVVHPNGDVALYAHLRAAYVFAGQTVRQGQVLGEVGETGLARGAHLHFELRRRGRPINPIPRFVRRDQAS